MEKNKVARYRLTPQEEDILLGLREGVYTLNTTDNEILEQNIKLQASAQKHKDINRIERKSWREDIRVLNAIEEYTKELAALIRDNSLTKFTKSHNTLGSCAGIFHFTDSHFNELVNITSNKYDFNVASKRCKLFVDKARQYFLSRGVSNILFAGTGDYINSDRRLDELLNMSTNRSKASFLAIDLIKQMILDLNRDFNVSVAFVSGNESRLRKDIEWSDMIATDNYDFTIYETLKLLFENCEGVSFIDGSFTEKVVPVANQNILLIHGNQKKTLKESDLQGIVGKWSKVGVNVDFIIFGHIHSTWISDWFARGASLVGDNAYSSDFLQLTGRASQNIHILSETERDSIKIDLQNVEGIEGYDINEKLAAYNAKSVSKSKPNRTILEIKI